jgi:hypothetical protein
MEAIKLKARVGPDAGLEWLEPLPSLPQGEVEVILIYGREQGLEQAGYLLPNGMFSGGRYWGGALRRAEIYDSASSTGKYG